MCRNYLDCDSASREEIRQFVAERRYLIDLVYGYAYKLADQIKGPHDEPKLKVAVTALSILNGSPDLRDVVTLALPRFHKRAKRAHIDAQAVFREVADFSSEAPVPYAAF